MDESCLHCGDSLGRYPVVSGGNSFCCVGCKNVYLLLKEHNLSDFYTMESEAGVKPRVTSQQHYLFLDEPQLRAKFIQYEDDRSIHTTLFLPNIHCSSCIYLLENLTRLHPGIQSCQVNFTKKEAYIIFDKSQIPFSELAFLLEKIGYAPNFGDRTKERKSLDKQLLYKLGIAGFAFGSIMLWSFPEYLGIQDEYQHFRTFTSYLSLLVSIPVLLYSARDYYTSAYKALKFKSINLDVPITIGIIALYAQSCWSILAQEGPGYMDSFAGFIFFLLIGKWFQGVTYRSLSFERDYSSYFPVAVTRLLGENQEEIVSIETLGPGDKIRVRNNEILPCDAKLASDSALFDYSFVTGEEELIHKKQGDFIYAGGRIAGKAAEFEVTASTDRSHLVAMWNKTVHSEDDSSLHDPLSVYFLVALLIIAFSGALVWSFIDASRTIEIIVAVLIVACPCALALSKPFTYGNIMRVLGRKGMYLKNTGVISKLNEITDLVFDKTGTLTVKTGNLRFEGKSLNERETTLVYAALQSSTHPYARSIVESLDSVSSTQANLTSFSEIKGKGIVALVDGSEIKLGSAALFGINGNQSESASHLMINGEMVGTYYFDSNFRPDIDRLFHPLNAYRIHVLSGDNEKDKIRVQQLLGTDQNLFFNQHPEDKLNYVGSLQNKGYKVMMVGDGLNDAGALGKADVGVAVSDDVFQFTPSSDAIIAGSDLHHLHPYLAIAKKSKLILTVCFVFSFTYNIFGLSFALSGNLSPLVAAVLMPLSSISVVLISTFLTLWIGNRVWKKKQHFMQ